MKLEPVGQGGPGFCEMCGLNVTLRARVVIKPEYPGSGEAGKFRLVCEECFKSLYYIAQLSQEGKAAV